MTQYSERMMTKRDVARVPSDIAFFLRLNGENPYKSFAYERAARALLLSPHEPHQLLRGDRLTGIPGIGPGLLAEDIVNTRSLPAMKAFLQKAASRTA